MDSVVLYIDIVLTPIRIRAGIKMMPVHIRILSQVSYVGKQRKIIYFYAQQCQFTMFFFSHQWPMCQDFKHFEQYIENFLEKK
jgi:hypothetical protein